MKQQNDLATKKDLEKVEQRLHGVENGLQNVEHRLQSVEEKVQSVEEKVQSVEEKVQSVEEKVQSVEEKVQSVEEKVQSVEERLSAKIEANSKAISRLTTLVLNNGERMALKEDMDKRLDEVISGIDGLARSFSILEQEKVVTNKRLDRIEAKLA